MAHGDKKITGRSGATQGKDVPVENPFNSAFGFDYDSPTDWQAQLDNLPRQLPIVGREYDERQMPIDWDYKTAVTGPNGEPLPNGASGWNFHGRADFGPGIDGWWKKMMWKLYRDPDKAEEEGPILDVITEGIKSTWDFWNAEVEAGNAPKSKPVGQALLALVGGVAQGLGSAWSNVEEIGPDKEGISIWNAIPRAVGVVFDTIGYGFETLDRAVKENITVPTALNAVASLRANDLVPQETIDEWREWIGPLGLFPLWANAAFYSLTGQNSMDDVDEDRNLLAARLGYTAWKDEAVKEEFLRRIAASEDPRLLAMELQDPIDELGGELLFDPLNVIFSKFTSNFLKAAGDTRQITAAAKVGDKAEELIQLVVKSDKVTRPIREAALFKWVDELVLATSDDLAGAARRSEEWGGFKGIISQTKGSLRSGLTEDMSDFFSELNALTRSPDDTMKALRALSDIFDSTATVEVRRAGLRNLNSYIGGYNVPLHTLFGERARRSALVWKRMMGTTDGQNIIDAMKAAGRDIVKMNDTLATEMAKITNDIFPTIGDKIKQNNIYKELIANGEIDKAEALAKKRPWAVTKPNALHATLFKTYAKFSPFYKAAGRVQGTLFMGLNPAYRMRNRMGNFAVMFVDQGLGTAVSALVDNRAMPWGKRWARNTLNNWMGGAGVAAEGRGIGRLGAGASFDEGRWMSGKFDYFARKASDDEAIAGTHIMARVVKRVVKGVLTPKKALRGIDAVFSPEDSKSIQRLSEGFHGDVVKAVREFAKQEGIGEFSTLLFLTERQMEFARGLDIEDALRLALDPSFSQEKKLAGLNGIIDDHYNLGARAAGESALRENPQFIEELTEVGNIIKKDLGEAVADEFIDFFERKLHANQMSVQEAKKVVNSASRILYDQVKKQFAERARAAGTDVEEAISQGQHLIGGILDRINNEADIIMTGGINPKTGKFEKGVAANMVEVRAHALKLIDDVNSGARSQDLYQAWQLNKWMGPAPAAFDDFTVSGFRNAVWQGYFDRAARKWQQGFQTQVEIYLRMFDDVIAAVDPDGVANLRNRLQPMIDSTRRKQGIADAMFRADMEDGYAFMRITPDELENMVIEELFKIEEITAQLNPKDATSAARRVQTFVNELRLRNQAGEALDLVADETMLKALENVAESPARLDEFVEILASKEPDNILTIDSLTSRRDFIIESAGPRNVIQEQIFEIQRQMTELGRPVRNIDEARRGTRVIIEGLEGGPAPGQVVRAYTTPGGKPKLQVEFTSGSNKGKKKAFDRDRLSLPDSETQGARTLDELQAQQDILNERLKIAPEDLDDATQRKVDDLNQRIEDIENRPILERLEEEVSFLPDPEPGMTRLFQSRPKTFDGTFDSVSWSDTVEGTLPWNPDGRYFWVDVNEDVIKLGQKKAIEAGVLPRAVRRNMEVHLSTEFISQATELDGKFQNAGRTFTRPVTGAMDDATPTYARVATKNGAIVKKLIDELKQQVNDATAGTVVKRGAKYTPEQITGQIEWASGAQRKVNEARSVAGRIATAERDFGLHNYGKRYGFDLLAGLVFPYQFWYSRSYAKWMKRLVQNPQILSMYLRYRRTLEKEHAGMPDWWKFQLNTNELLGLNAENPLFFNLEAMINPLNGITNVDFTDPIRRKDWWGRAMEDIQKMGPSVWTPFTYLLAAHYSFQGEDEAAARWAGRLLPQSKTFRDVTALIDPQGLGVEIDPAVNIFGGGTSLIGTEGRAGIEAYERGRVGRQLGMMLNEGKHSAEDIIDAGYRQTGEIWDLALARSINDRGGNLGRITLQFMFGVGLKPRPQNDIQIDNMYSEINNLMTQRPDLSPERYAESWNVLREAYPFMDTVLLSKKSGLARDEALAWNVLNRIPPGLSFELAERVNLDFDTLSKFRENKGELSMLTESERFDFMGGVLQLSALLAIPDAMTARDWTAAKNSYSDMIKDGEEFFGEDIWNKVDLYYAAFDENNQDAMRNFLRANPIVQEVLDFKQMVINSNPILASYYSSAEKLEKFYKGQFYQTAEQVFGENIWDKWSVYYALRDAGERKAASQYYDDHPELEGYRGLRDEVLPVIDTMTAALADQILEPKGPFYRDENTMPDPAIGVQSFNVDEQQRWIDEQVMAYTQGESARIKDNTDAMNIIRTQADALWPNTRSPANTYYNSVDANPSGAASMLQENPELEARVKWEFERILRVALSREGELEASAAWFQEELEELGAPESPTAFENLAPGPLQRLLNDPDGLPPHLWELLQGQ